MFAAMKEPRALVLLLGLVTVTTQDVVNKKNCDCKCKQGAGTSLGPVVSLQFQNEGKSDCNICEHRKEMLRKEKERELQFQKCPFEILGTPSMQGKTSEELFDGFRELLVPSQKGFFDMLRGVVKTMHVSSESELKWAKEKESKLLAQKKLMEGENERKIQEQKKKAEHAIDSEKRKVVGPIVSPRRESSPFYRALFKKIDLVGEPRNSDPDYGVLQGPNEENAPILPPRRETSPFLRALFKRIAPDGEPRNSDPDYGFLQHLNEDDALNLQNLESEKILSNNSPGNSLEKLDDRSYPVISRRMTEDDLLGLSCSCKKEKEIFNFDQILDQL